MKFLWWFVTQYVNTIHVNKLSALSNTECPESAESLFSVVQLVASHVTDLSWLILNPKFH
jgi:hypothetical protein